MTRTPRQRPYPRPDGLCERAAVLYPGDAFLQDEWRRAVATVRLTKKGWLLDRPTERRNA